MLFKNSLLRVISENNSNRHISFLVTCLIFILSLTIIGAMSIHTYLNRFETNFDSHLLFEITLPSTNLTEHQPLLNAIQQNLHGFEGISGSYFHDVIKESSYNLPVIYLEASVKEKYPIDAMAILGGIHAVYPKITLHTFDFFKSNIALLNKSLMVFSYLIIFFVSLSIIVTISLITRSGLRVHGKIIDVLKLIGAPNAYIARQFQWLAFRLGFLSSIVGIISAVFLLSFGFYMMAYFNIAPSIVFDLDRIFIFAVITPFFIALMSLCVARFEVVHLLTKIH